MNSGSYAWSNVASFAPQLTLKVPASPPTCHTIALVSLPPALYFDPFTARLSEAQLVRSAKLFGTLELEKPVGWSKRNTTARSIEAIPRMWWEGDRGEASEAVCVDEACEYSTLLLVLDGSTNLEVNVPLHLRYLPPIEAVNSENTVNADFSWLKRLSLVEQLPTLVQSLWTRVVVPLLERSVQVINLALQYTKACLKEHYVETELMPDIPLFLAACDKPLADKDWDPIDASLLVPSTHAHLASKLAQYLDAFMLYESARMPEAETSSAIEMPVGNASLNLVVHLITLGTALFASLLLGRSILCARRHAI